MYKYCSAKFNRGTGLGNKLFPWARCIVYAQETNCQLLATNWIQIRKASFLAGGIDYSVSLGKILLINNFIPYNKELPKLKSFFIKQFNKNKVNFFQGDGVFFADLQSHHEFIKNSLLACTNSKSLIQINEYKHYPIVLNIRRGKDFKDAITDEDFINKGAIRTPLNWFIETLIIIRKFTNHNYPALVVSDGTADDLKELLVLPNTKLAKTDKAITDLLLLSQSKVLLGSGGSSFSAWGSFLSKAITLTIPGQNLQWFKVSNNLDEHLVDTFDPNNPNKQILTKINDVLQTKNW